MTTDLTKPVQTCDGQSVTILTTERDDPSHPVVGMTEAGVILTYTLKGKIYSIGRDHELDLVNVPEKHTFWLNIYEDRQVSHPARSHADYFAGHGRIACVEVTYTEGEGL